MPTINDSAPWCRCAWWLTSLCLVVPLLASGCDEDHEPVVHIATGQVNVNGRPAEGVYLQFHAMGVSGRTAPDGTKTVADGTYRVPLNSVGEYAVTAFWPKVTMLDGEAIEGDDRLRGRYRHLGQPVTKIDIHEGTNELPRIELSLR